MISGGNASSLPLVGGLPEPTIKELSKPGRRAFSYPELDVPEVNIEILNNKSSIREFVIKTSKNSDFVIEGMADEGFLAGIKYDDNHLLVAVTEKRTKQELDSYVNAIKKVLNE